MASILKVDKIVDSGSNVLATSSGSGHTIDSGVTFPAGSIIQVQSTTKTDADYNISVAANTTSGEVITGLTVTLTPTATTNKVLVQGMVFIGHSDPDQYLSLALILWRNGAVLEGARADAASNRTRVTSANTYLSQTGLFTTIPFIFQDSPNSISAQTYGIELFHARGATSTIYINRTARDTDAAYDARGISTITAMEIVG